MYNTVFSRMSVRYIGVGLIAFGLQIVQCIS